MFLNVLAIVILIIHVMVIAFYYNRLPETIPVHFNAAGKADRWGKKTSIFLMPLFAMVILSIMIYAHASGKINAPAGWDKGEMQRMLRHLTYSTQLIFLLLSYLMIQIGLGKRTGLGGSFIYIVLLLIFYPFYFCIKAAI